MKPLNRPMFRYGGPIKEGVMSGIREPKKNGGLSKQFNTGLVGDERYPKTDGREHHVGFLAPLAWAARFAPAAWRGMKAARTFTPWAKDLGKMGRLRDIFLPRKGVTGPKLKGELYKTPFTPVSAAEKAGFGVGSFARTNPVTTFGIASTIPQAGYLGYKGAKAAPGAIWEGTKRWADAVIPGDQSRWWKDKSPKEKKEIQKQIEAAGGPPGGGDAGMKGDGSYDAKQAKIAAAKAQKEKIQKYRDIMDIKGMNKEAAANSLIEASRLINESGDFKGDLKSGSLINKIIQGASKAFDKPADTKKAIDTLILKGEIEKDIKADDPAAKLAAELTGKKIKLADKQLAGDTFEEIISAKMIKGEMFKGNDLASLLRLTKGIDAKVIPTTGKPADKDNLDYVKDIITKYNENPETGTYPEGVYVISDRIISVDAQGNVKKVL